MNPINQDVPQEVAKDIENGAEVVNVTELEVSAVENKTDDANVDQFNQGEKEEAKQKPAEVDGKECKVFADENKPDEDKASVVLSEGKMFLADKAANGGKVASNAPSTATSSQIFVPVKAELENPSESDAEKKPNEPMAEKGDLIKHIFDECDSLDLAEMLEAKIKKLKDDPKDGTSDLTAQKSVLLMLKCYLTESIKVKAVKKLPPESTSSVLEKIEAWLDSHNQS